MTINLTTEALYRLQERLGMMLGDKPATPHQWEQVAMAAFRWQRKNDPNSQTSPVTGPVSPILKAE